MDIKYVSAFSTVEPEPIFIDKTTVYLRRNISKVVDGNDETVMWSYEEAKLSHKDFSEYSSVIAGKNAINGVDDSDNIKHLVTGQENGDNNQLIIMEAIADLYDTIANMMSGGSTT